MTVFIPHPTEELKLIQAQRRMLAVLNAEKPYAYPVFPLWAFLNDENSDIDSLKNKIDSFEIQQPEIQRNNIIFPVTVKMNSGSAAGAKIVSAQFYQSSEGMPDLRNLPTELYFPLTCRIFRIAETEFTECCRNGRTWKVTRSFWHKK